MYYKGYRVTKQISGVGAIDLKATDNFAVMLTIPADYAGPVAVEFRAPLLWTVTYWISVLSAAAVVAACIGGKIYKKKHEKNIDLRQP